jgi:hypothetical protein
MLAIPDRRIGAARCQLRRQRHIRWLSRIDTVVALGAAPRGEKNSLSRCREDFMGARTRLTTRGNHGLGTDPRQFRGESRDSCVSDGRPPSKHRRERSAIRPIVPPIPQNACLTEPSLPRFRFRSDIPTASHECDRHGRRPQIREAEETQKNATPVAACAPPSATAPLLSEKLGSGPHPAGPPGRRLRSLARRAPVGYNAAIWSAG